MQLYIESDPNITYFDLAQERGGEMLPLAVFDLLTNNADRKGGHCILGSDGKVWSIDHGLTFHNIFKLRTVMLEFWGAEVPGPMVHDLGCPQGPPQLAGRLGRGASSPRVRHRVRRLGRPHRGDS